MKIIIAPDSFKGSISARALCASIKEGIARVFPQAETVELPLADGGEGTMENLVYASRGTKVDVTVTGPLGKPVRAAYGVLGDGRTVVIEMAQASGLPLVPPEERNPLVTTTYGTGELIAHALNAGYRRFIVALGGSATNDGGAGMMQALGLALLDAQGRPLPPGGAALKQLHRIDASGLDARLKESAFEVACDVSNPLCGPQGASAVFGPQKGATPEMVAVLDEALRHYGECIRRERGIDVIDAPGAGAAGGMGAALLGFLDARMRSGIDMVLEAVGWTNHLAGADLIITGEGKLDEQTLSGKVIAGVCRTARERGVPVAALCGAMALTGADMDRLGLSCAFSIVKGPCRLEDAMRLAPEWAADQAEQMMRMLRLSGVFG
jgi:glycerate kinase